MYNIHIQRDLRKRPTKGTYERDLRKRPTKGTYERDLRKGPTDYPLSALRSGNTVVRKENRIHSKRPMTETYTTGQHSINNQHCAATALRYAKRAIHLKRDLQKRPTKETCKTGPHTIDCLHCAAAALRYAK